MKPTKMPKPFWNVPMHHAPIAFNSTTPQVRKRFVVPMDVGQYNDTLECCPNCGSENIENEVHAAEGVFALNCHECDHTWNELNPI